MTSALQLFYIWNSPARRSREPAAANDADNPDSHPDPRLCRRSRRNDRRRLDGDSSRNPHGCHSKNCRSHRERELGRSTCNDSDGFLPGHISSVGVSNSTLIRLGLIRNNQLPGAVEEARRRLSERLRSVSLTESRQRALVSDSWNDESAGDDHFDANNASFDQEIHSSGTNSRPNLNILYGESATHTHRPSLFHIENKEISAVRWDAYCAMKGESCRTSEEKHEGGIIEPATECCICLEEFKDEDRLVKLLCVHKFHHACLELWVRFSGDCPLCRADII